jgi:AraC-like DNA-binding protein
VSGGPPSFQSVRGPLVVERRLLPAPPGLVALEQRLAVEQAATRVLATGDGWMLSAVEVERGRLLAAGRATPRRFTLFVPPRSTLALRFEAASFWCLGVAGLAEPPIRHHHPVLLDPGARRPQDATEVLGLAGSRALRALRAEPAGAAGDEGVGLMARARQALHQHRSTPRPLAASAEGLGLAPPALCKAFRAAHGITPKQYVQRARVFDAVLLLLLGTPVVEAALGCGFADLSRFYRQFGRLVGATPALYQRAAPARTAKTRPPEVG